MSYLEQIEVNFKEGKISLQKREELIYYYNNLSQEGKNNLDEKQLSENFGIDDAKNINNEVRDNKPIESGGDMSYFFSLGVAIVYSLVTMQIKSKGDFSRFYEPVWEFFMNFIVILILSLIVATPIKLITKKKFSNVLFWTILVVSILALFGNRT